ncbi:methyltransferase [Candidatus Woesearchaeota archaeon]|nr:methyltransferase [Candidatus Woesearchaeota archaeon]
MAGSKQARNKCCVLVDKGCESTTAFELKTLGIKSCSMDDGTLTFTADYPTICEITANSQSIRRAGIILEEKCPGNNLLGAVEAMKPKLPEYLQKESLTFKARLHNLSNKNFVKQEVEAKAGEAVLNANPNLKVKMQNNSFDILCIVQDNSVKLMLDLGGKDLSKREYKAFTHPSSIRGTIGFHLLIKGMQTLQKNKYKKGDLVVVDPFCGSGVIPIESELYFENKYCAEGLSFQQWKVARKKNPSRKVREKSRVYGFDWQYKHIKAARKNASIAGIKEKIEFSNCQVADIDTKFREKEVDLILTNTPVMTKRAPKVADSLKELFYQARYILADKGCLVLLTNNSEKIEEFAAYHSFNTLEKETIITGKSQTTCIVFKKNKKEKASI